jgi:hypothetical protein
MLFLDYCKSKNMKDGNFGKSFCEFFSIMDGDIINEIHDDVAYMKIQVGYLNK